MRDFNKKHKSKFWHSPLFLLFLLCVLVIFSYNTIGLFKKEIETTKKKTLVLDRIDSLNKRKDVLNNDINKLKTEEGIESVIRDKYQVVKEGEKMLVIVDDENEDQNEEIKNDHSFWGWIKKTFDID